MRILPIIIVCYAVCALATESSAERFQLPPTGVAAELSQLLSPYVPPSLDFDKEIAGLSTGSRPEILTWERIYALALVRARSVRGAFAASLDPKALNQEATRHDVDDFARFRRDFFTGRVAAGGAFRDPSAHVFGLLGRLNAIDTSRRVAALHDSLHSLLQERSQSESSGVSRLDVELVDASKVRARQILADEIRQFADGLDELKFTLGLSPHAAVILDRQSLAPFRAVQDSVASWTRIPVRDPQALHNLIARLPALGEVILGGQHLLAQIASNSDRFEEFVTDATELAVKNRSERDKASSPGNSGVRLELQVRRRIRNLSDAPRAYEGEKRLYELAIRAQDQTFERLIAPASGANSSRSQLIERLIDQVSQVKNVEDRLVFLWTSFRAERLELYRDLGALPFNDWKSFYGDVSAAHGSALAVPVVPPKPATGNDGPAPPPPAAPLPGTNSDGAHLSRARFNVPPGQSAE